MHMIQPAGSHRALELQVCWKAKAPHLCMHVRHVKQHANGKVAPQGLGLIAEGHVQEPSGLHPEPYGQPQALDKHAVARAEQQRILLRGNMAKASGMELMHVGLHAQAHGRR